MGCEASQMKEPVRRNQLTQKRTADVVNKHEKSLKLTSCKIQLHPHHLNRANQKFLQMLESENEMGVDRRKSRLSGVVERLLQRLLCGVGHLDPRFDTKFLIRLNSVNPANDGTRMKFRYLVHLDALSTPSHYDEPSRVRILQGTGRDTLPAGYGRIKLTADYSEHWSDLINHQGYLRRDKIQERFMELLATTAGQPDYPLTPLDVDESRHCGAPGKVVDPLTLHHLLRIPAQCHCFYGAAESDESRYPDPRDFRIAIVEGVPEIRLHVSFLSPAAHSLSDEDAEIVLTLCVGVADWPQQSDFPYRLPLDHPDVLSSYSAAQTGYILVPNGPHHTMRCEDRASVWEIRTPAAEVFLQDHYSEASVVKRTYRILKILMEILRARGMKTLNSYLIQNLLFWELEKKHRFEDWTADQISRRIICMLDTLAVCLRMGNIRSYFFPTRNLLLQAFVAEEDYRSDADILETYLTQFQQERANIFSGELSLQDHLERVLLTKWNNVIASLVPLKSRKLSIGKSSSVRYSKQQMEYISVLFREILKLRQIQESQRQITAQVLVKSPPNGHLDEFIYLLQSVFEQAKTRAWNTTEGETRRKLKEICDTYDVSTAMLIDALKRDGRIGKFESDIQLVAKVIECLHTAIESDGKILGPILRPYLDQLFQGSHENCWFLAEYRKRSSNSELEALGAFSKLVLTEHLDPLQGLLDCVSKGWTWAKHALYILKTISDQDAAELLVGHRIDNENSGLRLIFTPFHGQTVQYTLQLSDKQNLEVAEYLTDKQSINTPLSTLKKGRRDNYATVRSLPEALYGSNDPAKNDTWFKLRSLSEKQPPHGRLRDASPLTVISTSMRRNGTHRGLGGIVQALISLHKLSVLQEICVHLPEDARGRVLADIQRLSREVQRISRRRSDVGVEKTRFSFRKPSKTDQGLRGRKQRPVREMGKSTAEVYRSRNEFTQEEMNQGIEEIKQRRFLSEIGRLHEDTLLGTCRKLRARHRNPIENIEYFQTQTGMAARYGTIGAHFSEQNSHGFAQKTSTLPTKSKEMTEI